MPRILLNFRVMGNGAVLAASALCTIHRKGRETPAHGARQSVFYQKTPTPVRSSDQLKALTSITWPISESFSKRERERRFARMRFARNARRRRDDVAWRRRGGRHASTTLCLRCFARRRLVWSTDAAHLAARVCRQPPKRAVETTTSRCGPVVLSHRRSMQFTR